MAILGQVIDVYFTVRRNIAAAQKFFTDSLSNHGRPAEVTTDLAAPLLRVIDELIPEAVHDTEQYANNRIENDHGRLKARLRPMRALRTASIVIQGHAFKQNVRRWHYELGVEARHEHRRQRARARPPINQRIGAIGSWALSGTLSQLVLRT
ncbi:MAG: IS6 family transposase [Candidatus Poriferisodalaceae bacterium]|jgi:IS6 family transposase